MWHSEEEIRDAIFSGDVDRVAAMLDGQDYDRGQIEALEATCHNLRRTVAYLILKLHGSNHIIRAYDVSELFSGNR